MDILTLTPSAQEKIRDILAEENKPDVALRCFVQGGGCAGFSYGFALDDTSADDDFLIEFPGLKVLIDSMSAQYLAGATVDYVEELLGSNFVIRNPNATTTCGCGSSFTV